MILELTYARGLRLWLDGQTPDSSNWTIGEKDDHLTFSENDGSPLRIGQHKIVGLKSDVPLDKVSEDKIPEFLTVLFQDAPAVRLAVTHWAWGDPDDDEPVTVTLTNGETITVDEITLFLRASTGTPRGTPVTQITPEQTSNVHKQHSLDEETWTITQRRCWSVNFNVNGNAPSDSVMASFATRELANQAHALWAAIKDDDKTPCLIVNGERYWDLQTCSVEGYNFDTWYEVIEDWQEDKNILTSLAQLTDLCDSSVETGEPDGIAFTILDEECEDDEDSDDLVAVTVDITGPKGTSLDDLINGAREAIARAGYEVGDVDYVPSDPDHYSPDHHGEAHLFGTIEVDECLAEHVKIGGDGFDEEWQGITVHAEAP